jgi:hypothetical protein
MPTEMPRKDWYFRDRIPPPLVAGDDRKFPFFIPKQISQVHGHTITSSDERALP